MPHGRLIRIGLVALMLGCVSRSTPDARFRESLGLQALSLDLEPADPERFTFGVVGDLHIRFQGTALWEGILDEATNRGDRFMVCLGDIVDQGDAADVEAFWAVADAKGWSDRVVPVIGNHDVFHGGWEAYRDRSGPSHFAFTAGRSRFIAIDTADGSLGEAQFEWFEEELGQPHDGPLFVLSHYLPVIPGIRTYLKIADEAEALRLMALARRHGVKAWFGGHYHSYVTGHVEGVDYVVAGGGGRRMPPVLDNFYVQVGVDGDAVTYTMVPIKGSRRASDTAW